MLSEKGKSSMDIYIRMNSDSEKDYCFTIKRDAKVTDLLNIFETLPLSLSPSYFYDYKPAGFASSVHPGYLTAAGALLFGDDADDERYLKKVDQNSLISEAFHEGQLVVPLWRYNAGLHLRFLSILLTWLYLDLPEHLTPTPGVAPTTVMMNVIQYLIPWARSSNPTEDPFDSQGWRYVFFALHVLKVGFIYLLFAVGVFNPRSLNPLKSRQPVRAKISQEVLLELGWTSARRLPFDEWDSKYRDYIISKCGGVVKAFSLGELEKPEGIMLGPGEGFAALGDPDLANHKVDSKTFLNEHGKFVVSPAYSTAMAKPLAKMLTDGDLSPQDKHAKLKEFRQFGYMDCPEDLKQLVETVSKQHQQASKS